MSSVNSRPFLVTIKGMDKCPFLGVINPKLFKDSLSYKPDPSDVFVAAYPKCGTTWAQLIVYALLNDGKIPTVTKFIGNTQFLEYFVGKENMEKLEKPRQIKTHLPFNLVPYNPNTKYVYIARNPFDCCVSYYNHHKGLKAYEFDGSFDEYFECFMQGEVDFGDYFDCVMSWYEHREDENILFLTYEEMKMDITKTITKIGKFIGGKSAELVNDSEKVKTIIDDTSFDSLKVLPMPEAMRPFVKGEFNIFRKGIIGDFRNNFKDGQFERLKEKYDEKMKNTYLHDFWNKLLEI